MQLSISELRLLRGLFFAQTQSDTSSQSSIKNMFLDYIFIWHIQLATNFVCLRVCKLVVSVLLTFLSVFSITFIPEQYPALFIQTVKHIESESCAAGDP